MSGLYRVEYDASVDGDGSMPVVWEKTAEELLTPNGPDESLLDWLLRETDRRGGAFRLERLAPEVVVGSVQPGAVQRRDG